MSATPRRWRRRRSPTPPPRRPPALAAASPAPPPRKVHQRAERHPREAARHRPGQRARLTTRSNAACSRRARERAILTSDPPRRRALPGGAGSSCSRRPAGPRARTTRRRRRASTTRWGSQLFDAREHEQALIEFEQGQRDQAAPGGGVHDGPVRVPARSAEGRAHALPGLRDRGARRRVRRAGARPDREHRQAQEHVRHQHRPRRRDGADLSRGDARARWWRPARRPTTSRCRAAATASTSPSRTTRGRRAIVDVDIAETKPLFFKLEPIPARLEIETKPLGATLYVNGNRARNPYRQDIAPGPVEIFAEAPDYESRSIDFSLAPGEHRALVGGDPVPAHVQAALGAAGAARRVGGDRRSLRRGRGRRRHRQLDPGPERVVGLAGDRRRRVGRHRRLARSPRRSSPATSPTTARCSSWAAMWIGARRGRGGRRRRPAGRHQHGRREDPCPGPGRAAARSAISCAPGSSAARPGWRWGSPASVLVAEHAPTYGRGGNDPERRARRRDHRRATQLALQWQPYGCGWPCTVRQVDRTYAIARAGVSVQR